MRQIESVEIASQSREAFVPGGKHVMLMQPITNLAPGDSVTLEIQVGQELLLVNATLQNRTLIN